MKTNAHDLLELVKAEKHAADKFIYLPPGQRAFSGDLIPVNPEIICESGRVAEN
jgi:hypothetical protein